jgi:hypothetical protein
MLSGLDGLLGKVGVRVSARLDNDQLNVLVGEEVLLGAVVANVGEVDRAVRAGRRRRLVLGCLGPLEDGDELEVPDGVDEGQVEGLGTSSVTDDSDLDGSHDV